MPRALSTQRPLAHHQRQPGAAGCAPAQRRCGVLGPDGRAAASHAAATEAEQNSSCQRERHDHHQDGRGEPGGPRAGGPCACGRRPAPPWSRRPVAPEVKRRWPGWEFLLPGYCLVLGQRRKHREHGRQLGLAGMQRMLDLVEDPLLAGGRLISRLRPPGTAASFRSCLVGVGEGRGSYLCRCRYPRRPAASAGCRPGVVKARHCPGGSVAVDRWDLRRP